MLVVLTEENLNPHLNMCAHRAGSITVYPRAFTLFTIATCLRLGFLSIGANPIFSKVIILFCDVDGNRTHIFSFIFQLLLAY
jgi:hypothetical protein